VDRANEESIFTTGENYVVRRSRTPVEVISMVDLKSRTSSHLGGQAEWFWGLPGAFHALASPRTSQPVPAPPRPAQDEAHSQSLGYWCALQYLLLHRLGWSNPRKGLMHWYDMGKPTDDPTLALVSEVWDRDGHLDIYLAWLMQLQPHFLDDSLSNGAQWGDVPEPLDATWSAWLRSTKSSLEESRQPHFALNGGSDSLHLAGHVGEGGQPDPNSSLSVLDVRTNRAVFVTDSMDAWYWDLRDKAIQLAPTVRSWRIDVFVRPVGFLGNFRLSRSTGLPFSGRHRYHSMGN